MLRRVFGRAGDRVVDCLDRLNREGCGEGRGCFSRGRCVPTVAGEKTRNVRGGGQLDVRLMLAYVNAVKIADKSKIDEGWLGFARKLEAFPDDIIYVDGSGFKTACHREVIHLSEKEHGFTIKVSSVYGAIMRGRVEAEVVGEEDGVDVFLPEPAGFGVAL
jgi:hypothetical protein